MFKGLNLFRIFVFFTSLDFYFGVKVVYFYAVTNSYSITASIISVSWITAALAEIPTGIFSDLIGRKRTIILGAFLYIMSFVMYGLSPDYWILVFGAIMEGAGRACYSGNNNAYIHNLLSDEGRTDKFADFYGKLGSISLFSSSIASLLSGFILNWSVHFFMWINLIPHILAFITAIFLKEIKFEEKRNISILSHLKEAFLEVKTNIKLRYLSLSMIFGGAGAAAYEFQAAAFNTVWPTWAIGIARWLTEILIVPGSYFSGRLINKFGAIRLLLFGSLTTWLGNILAGAVHSFISPLIIVFTHLAYGPGDTAEQTLIQNEFTEKQRATIASLNSLGSSIYFTLVINICGLIATSKGPFLALIMTQIFYLPVLYYEFKLAGKIKNNL